MTFHGNTAIVVAELDSGDSCCVGHECQCRPTDAKRPSRFHQNCAVRSMVLPHRSVIAWQATDSQRCLTDQQLCMMTRHQVVPANGAVVIGAAAERQTAAYAKRPCLAAFRCLPICCQYEHAWSPEVWLMGCIFSKRPTRGNLVKSSCGHRQKEKSHAQGTAETPSTHCNLASWREATMRAQYLNSRHGLPKANNRHDSIGVQGVGISSVFACNE